MNEKLQDLFSRKFLFAVMLVVGAYAFVFTGELTALEWTEFAKIIGAIYVIGNSTSSLISTINKTK